MDDRWHQRDGFYTATGLFALVCGPYLLVQGAPAGWMFLMIAIGVAILGFQSLIVLDIHCEAVGTRPLVLAFAALTLLAIAVVYLTRAANDLPSLFPGHDGDSEHFRLVPGIVTFTIGSVALARAVLAVKPKRSRA